MHQLTLSNNYRSLVHDSKKTSVVTKANLLYKFKQWVNTQEENRLLWLGIAVLGGIATVLPITLLAVVFWANNSLTLWAIACSINVPILVLNLAAQPTKITLPILFLVWLIDALIIAYCAIIFFANL
ncbi:MAG: hypothetical protein ABIW34_15075 [Ginsengibacter sp.]